MNCVLSSEFLSYVIYGYLGTQRSHLESTFTIPLAEVNESFFKYALWYISSGNSISNFLIFPQSYIRLFLTALFVIWLLDRELPLHRLTFVRQLKNVHQEYNTLYGRQACISTYYVKCCQVKYLSQSPRKWFSIPEKRI